MANANCLKCKHFQISWDPNQPRSCKIYGFKSKQIPSIIVKQSTGEECQAFEEKIDRKKKDLGLNDPKYW